MRRTIAIIAAVLLLAGCASKPTFVEYYPPVTEAEQSAGHGALKVVELPQADGRRHRLRILAILIQGT